MSKKAVREDGQFSIKIEEGELMPMYMCPLPQCVGKTAETKCCTLTPPTYNCSLPLSLLPSLPLSICLSFSLFPLPPSLYNLIKDCELFAGLSTEQEVLLTHGDSVEKLAESFQAVAHSGNIVAAIQHKALKIYGLQFHPEVDLTDKGADMMRNYLYNVS